MALVKYKPQNNLVSFDSIIDDIFNFDGFVKSPTIPNYNIIENDDEYLLEFSVAGYGKGDIDITIKNNVLKINGEKEEKKDVNYVKKQIFYGNFEKSFDLPENIVENNIEANFNNGILSIKLPKDSKSKINKKIEIK